MARVLTTVERVSCMDGILPPGHGFDAESSKEIFLIEAKYLAELRESTSHLRASFMLFKEMQDARCKPFEDETSVVVREIQRQDPVRLGHEGGHVERTEEAIDDGAGVREDVLPVHEDDPVHEAAHVHDPCPSSDVLVDEVHGSENKHNDDVSVALEKAADMSVSGAGCFDGVVLTEPQSSVGAEVSDAKKGKTTGDIILEKDHVESVVQTGGSATASPEKSPAAEPSVDVDAVQAQPNIFLVSDSPVATAAAGVLPDDTATSTGDDDEDTESDSYGEEVDHSSAATGLGKDP
ncbi:uncharacterized protein LOC119322181 isoform X2 [Triticum dicoccoides]|uniref:uncharacterized protein LOC119322181 isoform X2 n=1 Tax=Triticum dicoccoides TaxID=85692 RepID=UPI001891953C|nr:uncharacterized protein LOC119322181 isoform X2 [Triticum dicoccoides]